MARRPGDLPGDAGERAAGRYRARRLASVVVWLVGILLAVQEVGVSVAILLVIVVLFGVAAIIALRIPLENYGAK